MKKMALYTVLFLVVILILRSCTVLNLSPTLLFKGAKFKRFPELQDNLIWADFSLRRATQTNYASIKYYPVKNFFVIFNYEQGVVNPIKIDGAGNKIVDLKLYANKSFGFLDMVNCFAIGTDSIYDLSAEKVMAEPFSEVLNREQALTHKAWVEDVFGKLYNVSDVVLYSLHTEMMGVSAVYFHHQGKWTKLYAPKKSPEFIYPASGMDVICKINKEKIPHKWHEEIYLKDVAKTTYSNENRYTDAYITPFNSDNTFFPEQLLDYQPAGKLKVLVFAKETYTTEGYYNPGIPNQFYGTAYYSLEVENKALNFKTVANKASFGEELETYLYLFGLPAKFSKQSSVRFLSYDYGTNFHENLKKGIYVIRKD